MSRASTDYGKEGPLPGAVCWLLPNAVLLLTERRRAVRKVLLQKALHQKVTDSFLLLEIPGSSSQGSTQVLGAVCPSFTPPRPLHYFRVHITSKSI